MPIPRDSAFQAHSQAGDGPSMPRSAAEPTGARHARGLDGTAPVWPPPSPRLRRAGPHGTIRWHHQKYQRFSGFYALGATLPPACHPLQANKISRLRASQPTMAPSDKPLVPLKTMCRQPLSHIRVAVLLSCPPKVPPPPPPISFSNWPRPAQPRAKNTSPERRSRAGFTSPNTQNPRARTSIQAPGFASADRQNRSSNALTSSAWEASDRHAGHGSRA